MVKQKLTYFVISAAVVGALIFASLRGAAVSHERSLELAQANLRFGAAQLELSLLHEGDGLAEVAAGLVADPALATELRTLTANMAFLAKAPRPPERLKATVQAGVVALKEKLDVARQAAVAAGRGLDALTLVTDDGVVLVSDSSLYASGARLPVPPLEVVDEEQQGAAAPPKAPEAAVTGASPAQPGSTAAPQPVPAPAPEPAPVGTELVVGGLRNRVTQGVLAVGGALRYVGLAPIVLKDRVLGVVLVERQLKALPAPGGLDSVLLIDGKVALGRAPDGFRAPTVSRKAPFVMERRDVLVSLPAIGETAATPFFVDAAQAGLWAQELTLAGAVGVKGYVFTDLTSAFVELAGAQTMALLLGIFAILAHAVMFALFGRRLMRGLETLADAIGRHQQGLADGQKLSDRNLPSGLQRLGRLVNQLIERAPAPATTAAAARPPSLDEVISAQAVPDAPAESGDFEFEGITNAGSLNLPSGQAAPASVELAAPPLPQSAPAADDGYENLTAFGDTVAAAEAMMEDAAAEPLPELPDALEAVDHLSDGASTQPPPPATAPATLVQAVRAGSPVAAVARPAAPPPAARLEFDDTPPHPPPADGLDESFIFQDEAEAAPAPAVDPLEEHYRDVFRQFVQIRKECGESTSELNFDKFRIKLDQSRDAVVQKHGSSEVRFQVYVKNGRAALRATPMR